jgi:DnaJ-class molecular chaperone
VLAVPPAATEETIKAAWKGLARIFHPDRCWLEDAHDLMTAINGAYAILSDKSARRRHDTVNKTAAQACERCEGAGHYFKQQGFKKRVQTTCPACEGTGRVNS